MITERAVNFVTQSTARSNRHRVGFEMISDHSPIYPGDVRYASYAGGKRQLFLQGGENGRYPLCPTNSQPPEGGAPNQHRPSPAGESFQDVTALAYSTV